MFDDQTYLKLFVDKNEFWDEALRQLYSKRLSKKEVKKRVAYTVVNGMLGKIPEGKGDTTLAICDTYSQYALKDWTLDYDKIQELDKEIVKVRQKLVKIPFLLPQEVLLEARAIWALQKLQERWNLTNGEAAEEISVYGIRIIEAMLNSTQYRRYKLRGRYHFVRALHEFANDTGLDLAQSKQSEANILSKTIYNYEQTKKLDTISNGHNEV